MTASHETLLKAIATIPAGPWAVAVSGGADSVALLHLALERRDLQLVVAHLDHETRAGESTADARFVEQLCARLGVKLVLARRSELEHGDLPANTQARYRMLRLKLFAAAIGEHGLQGVLQAHHADDQAETVFMRLLRGTGIEGMAGIPAESVVERVRIMRPLLGVRRALLREYLKSRAIAWREDSSNQATYYQRNRVRQLLAGREALVQQLMETQQSLAKLNAELASKSPALGESFALREIAGRHPLVQLHALREWAIARGAPAEDLNLEGLEQLRQMVEDMGTAPALCLPGNIEVRRRQKAISARPM